MNCLPPLSISTGQSFLASATILVPYDILPMH
jgi:hypothetical protein